MIHAPIVVREYTDRKENIWALNIHRPRTHRSCPSSRASNEDGLTDHDHIVSASLPNPSQTWRLTQLEGHEHKSDQVHWAGRVGLLHRWRLVVCLWKLTRGNDQGLPKRLHAKLSTQYLHKLSLHITCDLQN